MRVTVRVRAKHNADIISRTRTRSCTCHCKAGRHDQIFSLRPLPLHLCLVGEIGASPVETPASADPEVPAAITVTVDSDCSLPVEEAAQGPACNIGRTKRTSMV